ncbi:MAG TPA: DUF1707 domain-containing protein [Streptosporangiaceae bacterium]|nr:DUF1707 domain-containing protein [Streptosporangiaceae bacterium]
MSDDPPDLRASHADRDRVVDALRVAAGDGRLSAEELDTRVESALSARTLSSPGIVIDTDGLNLTYSKLKLHSRNDAADPRLRIELTGKLLHAKVIEQFLRQPGYA